MERLDLQGINSDDFSISRRGDLILITPRPTKHKWEREEMWLRSVLCTPEGYVVSRGFPKFLNWHEDVEFHQCAVDKATLLHAAHKLDGSLVIVSMGVPTPGHVEQYIRTRGNHDLGEFHDPVMGVIREKYPKLLSPGTMSAYAGHSFLFEYTAPDNQIVVQYSQAALTLVGVVRHAVDSKNNPPMLLTDNGILRLLSEYLGVPCVEAYAFTSIPELLQEVPKWEGSEGVVVSAESREYGNVLFKVKSEWYLMLHALRFQMTPRRLYRMLTLQWEEITSYQELQDYLYQFGYDYEVSAFLEEAAQKYFKSRGLTEAWGRCVDAIYEKHGTTSGRKEFVDLVRAWMEQSQAPQWTFHYAMALYSDKDDSKVHVMAQPAEVSARQVLNWYENRETLLGEALRTPQEFEEEDSDG